VEDERSPQRDLLAPTDWTVSVRYAGLGRVGSTVAKVIIISKDYVNAFKARLDEIGCTKQLNLLLRPAALKGTGN